MKLIINPRFEEGVCLNRDHAKETHKIGDIKIVFCDKCNKFWIAKEADNK